MNFEGFTQNACYDNQPQIFEVMFHRIHRKKKDGGCTFYHNTLRTKLSPLGIWKDNGLTAVVPILTALLLSSLSDLQFFFVFLYALLECSCAKHYR